MIMSAIAPAPFSFGCGQPGGRSLRPAFLSAITSAGKIGCSSSWLANTGMTGPAGDFKLTLTEGVTEGIPSDERTQPSPFNTHASPEGYDWQATLDAAREHGLPVL